MKTEMSDVNGFRRGAMQFRTGIHKSGRPDHHPGMPENGANFEAPFDYRFAKPLPNTQPSSSSGVNYGVYNVPYSPLYSHPGNRLFGHPSNSVQRPHPHGGHQGVADSPALSDVSVIPWNQRPHSTTVAKADSEIGSSRSNAMEKPFVKPSARYFEDDQTGHTRNSVNDDNESTRIKSGLPVRPIPHMRSMVPSEFLASVSRNRMCSEIGSRPPSTATSLRSTVLDFGSNSRNSSSFSSPRHSARGKKRGLSISPLSCDFIDLNEIIRASPNSLVAFITGSRGSSAASKPSSRGGSYGHLSASSISPSLVTPVPGLFSRQRNPFATPSLPKTPSSSFGRRSQQERPDSTTSVSAEISGESHGNQGFRQMPTSSEAVSTVQDYDTTSEATPKASNESDEEEGEDITEYRCQWRKCGELFDNQEQLVRHVNGDHIQKNKKDCTCYWEDCSREQKPFKAMYMLVVHVRRHTGEKPHKCHYAGCQKAYSRLENLKTHLRSHTGERPYVCEFEGCNKAFSNASDRAKHQNRTHSSIKQYGCKVPGCPKRYTDPSSLRKHMKTVHGNIAQPNKKMKGDKPTKETKKEKVERQEKEKAEERRKSVGECLTVKPLQKVSSSQDRGDPGFGTNNGSAFTHPRIHAFGVGHGINGETYNGAYRAWETVQDHSPSSTTDDVGYHEHSPRNNQDHMGEILNSVGNNRGPGVQVQAPSRPFLPRISGKPRAHEGLLHEVSQRLSDSRRSSNASLISVDSNYISGTESTYTGGSRRGSDVSLQSYLSSRRSSLASPMPPPSRLSPRNIASQTVIEGKVLEPASPQSQVNTNQGTNEGTDFAHLQNNRQSRVSSGYGSQNNYFHCKSPALQQLPTSNSSSKSLRRASEGNVKRLGDMQYEQVSTPKPTNQNRRGSEPIPAMHVLDQTPRRHSLNTYNPLPLPPAMQRRMLVDTKPKLLYGDMDNVPRGIIGNELDANENQQNMTRNFIQPNLFVQHQSEYFAEPQFPPSEEELARGMNLIPATSLPNTILQPADSTVSERSPYHSPKYQNDPLSPAVSGVGNWPRMSGGTENSVVVEADSTVKNGLPGTESYEDLMVREIRALNTGVNNNQANLFPGGTNMAINDMNTLLSSLSEENKYFESSNVNNNNYGNFI